MMPAPSVVSVSSNTSQGIHYAAPNKPSFIESLKSKGFRFHSKSHVTNGGQDPNRRISKPVHYKRSTNSAEVQNNEEPVHVPAEGVISDATYDSIGELMKNVPQSRRPTLPENHPGRLPEISNQQSTRDLSQGRSPQEPQPMVAPKPAPRKSSDIAGTNSEAENYGYDQADRVARQQYKVLPTKVPSKIKTNADQVTSGQNNREFAGDTESSPPIKPVPRRQGGNSTDNNAQISNRIPHPTISNPQNKIVPQIPADRTETRGANSATKMPLKPPLKSIHRRQTSNNDVENQSFQPENQEIQI